MLGKRFHGEGVRGVEIEILLETIGIEKVVTHPAGRKNWEIARIEIELDAFAGAEDRELVVGSGQEGLHVTVASVVASGTRVRACGA